MTSRMQRELVSSMVRRSTPMPLGGASLSFGGTHHANKSSEGEGAVQRGLRRPLGRNQSGCTMGALLRRGRRLVRVGARSAAAHRSHHVIVSLTAVEASIGV